MDFERILLFLFLLFIPTQLGKHFWPGWSYVEGVRVDYLSPTLYFLDIIWIILFLLSIGRWKFKSFKFKPISWAWFFLIGVNVLMAVNKWVAVWSWIRFGEVIWLFFYLKKRGKELKWSLARIIPVWMGTESLLGVAQLFKGGSLNGIFYWGGERAFSFNTIGVAQMSWLGEGLVRAYGTFSHPNSLAGFLLVSLILWMTYKEKGKKVWWWMVFWLGVIGILVSGSRLIWGLGLVILIYKGWGMLKDKKMIFGGILMVFGIVVWLGSLIVNDYPFGRIVGGFDDRGLTKRWDLGIAATKIVKDNPLFGVGLGNFLVVLPKYQNPRGYYWLQPVHNIYLLTLSEVGILGGLVFIYLIRRYVICDLKFMDETLKLGLLVILITGLWDHYWVTLPQNWWFLVTVLSLV